MPFVLKPPGETISLAQELRALGDKRKRAIVCAGGLRWIAVVVACLGVAGTLDFAFALPGFARALLLIGTLALAGALALRDIFAPGRQAVKPLRVAMLLEDRFPKFNDSLASAVEFSEMNPTEKPQSARFRKVAIARAKNSLERYRLDDIVPSGRAWRAFWLAILALGIVAPLAAINPARTRQLGVRLLDPFGHHPWPTKTQIRVTKPGPFPMRLAKGDALDVHFRVQGVIPPQATLAVKFDNGNAFEEVVPLTIPEGKTGQVDGVFRIEAHRITREFQFQLKANDGATEWFAVDVAPPPKLVPLDGRASPQIDLTFPRYTDLPPATLPDGASAIEAVHGTRVHFRAAADRRIASAVLIPQIDRDGLTVGAGVAAVAGTNPFAALASQLLADEVPRDIPLAIGADGTRLEATFIPRIAGLYQLRFTDETGLSGTRMFDFRLTADPAPIVSMDRPLLGQDPQTLLPTASVTVQARAEDRTYAVKRLVVEYRFGDVFAPARELVLALPQTGLAAPQQAILGFAARPNAGKPIALSGSMTIPLDRFRKPDGTPPVDGDTLILTAAATDFDDLTALKEPGRSKPAFEIRIVGKVGLDGLLQQELGKLRPQVLKLREEQRATRERTDEIRKAALDGKLTPDDAAKLNQAEKDQRAIQNQIADPRDGLKAQAQKLKELVEANKLPSSPTTKRVDAVAEDLARIADQNLDPIDQALAKAKNETDKGPKPDATKIAGELKVAVKEQKNAETTLDLVLKQLEQWAAPGEVRAEAMNLKDQVNKAGEQSAKATEKVEPGKPAEQLKPNEKADLNRAADKFNQLADRAAAALGKAESLAAEKDKQAADLKAQADAKATEGAKAQADADKQPKGSDAAQEAQSKADAAKTEADLLEKASKQAKAEADALRGAVQKAAGQELVEDLRRAGAELQQNNPAQSNDAKQSAADKLAKLADALGEKPPEGADELEKKKSGADAIDQLAAEQDELRKKTKAAAMIPDEKHRAEELAKLAREQDRLKKKTEDAAEKLTRDRQQDAADKLRAAAEQMEAAAKDLAAGKPPEEKQDDALQKLDEAVAKLDKDREKDADKLSQEKKEELAERLKALRDRLKATDAEAGRIQADVLKEMGWDRAKIAGVGDLEDRAKAIAEELRGFAEKNLEPLPVFQQLTEQAADLTEKSGRLFGERKTDALDNPGQPFDKNAEQATDDRSRRPIRTALRRLDHILESIGDKPKPMPKPMGEPPMPAEMPPGGDPPMPMPEGKPPGGVPPLAQLKALRAIQAEVNERTAALAKIQPDKTKLNDADREELDELEKTQRDIAELLEKIAPAFQPPPADPEKK